MPRTVCNLTYSTVRSLQQTGDPLVILIKNNQTPGPTVFTGFDQILGDSLTNKEEKTTQIRPSIRNRVRMHIRA